MVDDFYDPKHPDIDLHTCDGKVEPCYIEPPNMRTVWFRLPEFVTDGSCNQLSASRLLFLVMGLTGCFIAVWETLHGHADRITTMVATIAAGASGVYFWSTGKDYRWKKWWGDK